LAKKKSRGEKDRDTPVEVGRRAVVKHGKEFDGFSARDEGVVLAMDEEAGTCQIRFDGRSTAVTVATRHLYGIGSQRVGGSALVSPDTRRRDSLKRSVSSPAGNSPKVSVSSPAGNDSFTSARWKPRNISPMRSKRFNVVAKASWRDDGASSPQSRTADEYLSQEERSPGALSDADTQLIEAYGVESALRQALQQCSAAMAASLRAAQTLSFGNIMSLAGQREFVLRVNAGSYHEWQQSLVGLQSAMETCTRELNRNSTPRDQNNTSIEVPVELVGYRNFRGGRHSPRSYPSRAVVRPMNSCFPMRQQTAYPPAMSRSFSVPPPRSPAPSMSTSYSMLSPRSPAPGVIGSQISKGVTSVPALIQNSGGSVSLPHASGREQPSVMPAGLLPPPWRAPPQASIGFTKQEQQAASSVPMQMYPLVGSSGQLALANPAGKVVENVSKQNAQNSMQGAATRSLAGPPTSEAKMGDKTAAATRSATQLLRRHTARGERETPKQKSFSEWVSQEFSWGGGDSDDENA